MILASRPLLDREWLARIAPDADASDLIQVVLDLIDYGQEEDCTRYGDHAVPLAVLPLPESDPQPEDELLIALGAHVFVLKATPLDPASAARVRERSARYVYEEAAP